MFRRTPTPRLFCIFLALLTMTPFSQAASHQGIMLTSLKDNAVPGYELESGKGDPIGQDGFTQAAGWHSTMGRYDYHYTFASVDPEAILSCFEAGGSAFEAIAEKQRASGTYVNSEEEVSQLEYRFHQIPKDQLQGTVFEATWEGVLQLMEEAQNVFGQDNSDLIKDLAHQLAPHDQEMRSMEIPTNIDDQAMLSMTLDNANRSLKRLSELAAIPNFQPLKCGLLFGQCEQNSAWRNWVHLNLQAAAHLTQKEKDDVTDRWYDIENAAREFSKKGGDSDAGAPIKIYSWRWSSLTAALEEIKADVRNGKVEAWKIRAYLYKQSFYSNFAGYGYGLAFKQIEDEPAHLTQGAPEFVFKNQEYPPSTLVTLIDGDCIEEGIPEPMTYQEINDQATELKNQCSEQKDKIEAAKQTIEAAKQTIEAAEQRIVAANEKIVRLRIQRVKTNQSRKFKEQLEKARSESSYNSTDSGSVSSSDSMFDIHRIVL